MQREAKSVTAEQVPDLLLGALPTLTREWWAEVAEENSDPGSPEGRLHYLDAAWVVRELASRLALERTEEFDAVFDFVEHLIVHGDSYVSDLGVLGYLETMQSASVTSLGVDPEDFRRWLRPMSARYWEAIIEFWENGTLIPTITMMG